MKHSQRAMLPQASVTGHHKFGGLRPETRPGIQACWHLGPVPLKGLGEEPSLPLASGFPDLPQGIATSLDVHLQLHRTLQSPSQE